MCECVERQRACDGRRESEAPEREIATLIAGHVCEVGCLIASSE